MKFHTLNSAHAVPKLQETLLVASAYSDSILKFNALTGSPIGTFATGVDTPWDLVIGPEKFKKHATTGVDTTEAADDSKDIYVTSEHEDAVIQFHATTGAFKSKFTDKKVTFAPTAAKRYEIFNPCPF